MQQIDDPYDGVQSTRVPSGPLNQWLGTWTGRLLLVNTVVFGITCIHSGSLFLPDTETLLLVGAKDPVGLANGEIWRFFTPMFIHIGVLHFAANSFMLHVVGRQLEGIIGGRWFLTLYLLSGLMGNVSSAVFSVNLSAGASGAIFGLLGCGYFIERSIGKRVQQLTGQKPQSRAYAMTVAINLAFGFMVPFIDNAAHVGGLVAGVAVTFAMVNLRPNRLLVPRRALGIATLVALIVAIAAMGRLGSSRDYILDRLDKKVAATDQAADQVFFLSQLIEIDPRNVAAIAKRARLLYSLGKESYALHDVRYIVNELGDIDAAKALAEELELMGMDDQAWFVRRLIEHND